MTIIYVSPQGDSLTADLLAGTHSDGDVLNQKIFKIKDGFVGIAGDAFHVPVMFLDETVALNDLIEAIKAPGYLLRDTGGISLVYMPADSDLSVPCQVFCFQRDAVEATPMTGSTEPHHYYLYDQFDVGAHGIAGSVRVIGNPDLIMLKRCGKYVSSQMALELFSMYHTIVGIGKPPQQVFRHQHSTYTEQEL